MGSPTGELQLVEIQDLVSILERSLWPGGGTGAGREWQGSITSIWLDTWLHLEVFKVHFKESPLWIQSTPSPRMWAFRESYRQEAGQMVIVKVICLAALPEPADRIGDWHRLGSGLGGWRQKMKTSAKDWCWRFPWSPEAICWGPAMCQGLCQVLLHTLPDYSLKPSDRNCCCSTLMNKEKEAERGWLTVPKSRGW